MTTCAPSRTQNLYALAEAKNIPLNMMLELTYRCNERCLHCYLPETQGVRPPRPNDELTTEEWFRVLGEMAEEGTMYLILSGGEVLLRDDFSRILRRARELYFSVEIFTNATLLTPDVADEWSAMDVQNVGVSCYSPDAVWHDRLTRLQGSFEQTIRGVRLLKEHGLSVQLKTPLMKLNLDKYEGLIALAQELGVGYKFDPLLVPRNDGSSIPLRLGLDDERLRKAYQDERLIPAEDVFNAAPIPSDAPTCSAGRTSGAIGPYGDVIPCIQWMIPAGNVRENPFGEIWREGEILQKARAFTSGDVKPCPTCGDTHFMHCLGVSQLEHHDPLVPSSECCRLTKAVKSIQTLKEAA